MATSIGRKITPIKFDGLDEKAEKYIKDFEKKLILEQKSPNTVVSYVFSVKGFFLKMGSKITQKKLQEYKDYLQENLKTRTVALRLGAINEFLKSIGKRDWELKLPKFQKRTFLKMLFPILIMNF